MTLEQVLEKLRLEVKQAGSQAKWAQGKRVSRSAVSFALTSKRDPDPAVISALGLRRVISYEPISPGAWP